MKSAIYIADGVTQFVLTPETEMDKRVLEAIETDGNVQCFRGSAYHTRGGWPCYENVIAAMIERGELIEVEEC